MNHGGECGNPRSSGSPFCRQIADGSGTQKKARQICSISTSNVRHIAPGIVCIYLILLAIVRKIRGTPWVSAHRASFSPAQREHP